MSDPIQNLPCPRLQLRWTFTPIPGQSVCHYEIVIPLGEHDIRRGESNLSELTISIGSTTSEGARRVHREAPYRDGAHSKWDSKALGLPVYLIGEDGGTTLFYQSPEKAP